MSWENLVIVCNGYKDCEFVCFVLIGEKMGCWVYIVVEKFSELKLVLDEVCDLDVKLCIGLCIWLSLIGKGNW